MIFGRSIYVKKVMKLLAFIFEQPSYDEVKENMFDMSSMRNKKRSKKNIIYNPYVSC